MNNWYDTFGYMFKIIMPFSRSKQFLLIVIFIQFNFVIHLLNWGTKSNYASLINKDERQSYTSSISIVTNRLLDHPLGPISVLAIQPQISAEQAQGADKRSNARKREHRERSYASTISSRTCIPNTSTMSVLCAERQISSNRSRTARMLAPRISDKPSKHPRRLEIWI